ncbi:MAG TPA: preprotein translocase subunit SecY [Candidatus Omnitrophota bacterium]|nr:preprotein translocase subunit SecY [Candidatus Omnitrophota bacterium]HPB67467.1 preprotein translocase subunit SecY [Candidatus Omnitrophota bacterium]HQO57486.1 preprotein translocase subunit SecY [Candidatus Omnitrophota bacterium]HQP11485.1 preprotein translocase subunit SecY [Candidatus Omnitrophota bacterium]
MIAGFANCFKIPDLRKRILITLGIIALYRVGCFIPTPGVNGAVLTEYFMRLSTSNAGSIFGVINMFSGGAIAKMTVFALGIMPYISSSIIMQLLTAVVPALEKLSKEGQAGYHKINQYTRYGTLFLCLVQSFFIALWMEKGFGDVNIVNYPGWAFRISTVLTLTCGTLLLMWLGEQIQERGIGQGISLIITAGIVSSAPQAIQTLVLLMSAKTVGAAQLQPLTLMMMLIFLVAVVVAITLITQAQRKIPVQYARRIVGRKVYGGQSTYLPLKVDTAGIIAIIFAQSIILFPATLASFIPSQGFQSFASFMQRGHVFYYGLYGLLIIFFCYFYTAIVFNPIDVAENLKKHGGFIPGVRPGIQTANYLEFVLERITLAGAFFICAIAIMPDAIMASFRVPYLVASFFGGTGVLITVGVMLDTMKQIESHLLMRHYDGFMKSGQLRGRR